MMLSRAVDEPLFEVIMLAFHMLNQNARTPVLEKARVNRIGTLCMFAVRNIFSRPGLLQETIAALAAEGKLPAALAKERNPLGFLVHAGGADSLVEAAYRFARHEPGIDVVLFGTGSIDHLRANIASILRPPLPAADVARLNQMFGHLVGVGLDLPDHITAKPAPKT
jgi:aryl-alcohol dehydrogenase-like predicted oxidoreductase